eukprot:jgi/Ulvmu1/1392/UM011_0120.1
MPCSKATGPGRRDSWDCCSGGCMIAQILVHNHTPVVAQSPRLRDWPYTMHAVTVEMSCMRPSPVSVPRQCNTSDRMLRWQKGICKRPWVYETDAAGKLV